MLSNPALDVVIGLVFIYLLYSLYATIVMEIISSSFGLRARNLRYTIARMLMDEKKYNWLVRFLTRWLTSFIQTSGYAINLKHRALLDRFLEQPSIKYLSNGGINNKPSYLTAENFSRSLIEAIQIPDTDISQLGRIKEGLLRLSLGHDFNEEVFVLLEKTKDDPEEFKKLFIVWYTNNFKVPVDPKLKDEIVELINAFGKDHEKLKQRLIQRVDKLKESDIGPETRRHIESLLEQANNDLVKFRILLEHWFNETMERSSGWFKRTTQMILFVIGFVLAVSFNVDTLAIIRKLSIDKDAREKIVTLATDFSEKNQETIQSIQRGRAIDTTTQELNARLDELNVIRERLEKDMDNTQSLLSSDWHLPDSIELHAKSTQPLHADSIELAYPENTNANYLRVHKTIDKSLLIQHLKKPRNGWIEVNKKSYKLGYVFTRGRVWGYLLTVLALSLGAPFWFDLLNKLVKLRSSNTATVATTKTSSSVNKVVTDQEVLNRVG